ncbi:DUF1289 domain-containing protein [Bradyrhizobium prioriisuperbiae]|uniref:DUF1289 domain-containing protein n=1 Tax=Bradyrhizobium prioriisuperbiae TaxID=2854389 RepID=UPI0028E74238|nr:DUF1289 domain-containing protein [Bradyrhizobium prioritasuperba]
MSIESPCIKVCILDAASGLCRGCARTLSEIGVWASMQDAERRAIMAALPDRMRTAGFPAPTAPADPSTAT